MPAHRAEPAEPALPWWAGPLLRMTRMIPARLAWELGARLGWWFGLLPMRDQQRARANLRRAFPQATPDWIEHTACACFRHFGRMALWTIATCTLDPRRLMRGMAIEGVENLRQLRAACQRGEGTVGFTGHFGNWELFSRIGAQLVPLTVIGRRLRHPVVDRLVQDLRRGTGARMLYQDADLRHLVRDLRSGRLLATLADQDIPRLPGVHVPWFGIPAHTPSAPAALALLAGGGVTPAYLFARAGRWVVHIGPRRVFPRQADRQADIQAITAWVMAYEERLVRLHPEQYVWWHLRWRTPPPAPTTP